jgi:hypothetical protein
LNDNDDGDGGDKGGDVGEGYGLVGVMNKVEMVRLLIV